MDMDGMATAWTQLPPSPKTTTNMIVRITSFANMGRGAYDTTGCPKPPPRPKPS
ncbi:hypothetical protein VD0002_g455 [Verticillium dahliae]|nr:hypothetical protein VD0004_g2022 [Verticillium dahliae]PNH56792.1 hypothetical protein VD0003_g1002 [Verticillium dahliae]PNH70064.1 hypothetical protein VD0002_g455 [Verticillium dahliae]PNH75537.1 hypothetical protein VD0001_g2027 [Verticillium dahliae]